MMQIIKKKLSNLNTYLLLHHPVLWASKLHRITLVLPFIFAVNFTLAHYISIDFQKLPNGLWIMLYFNFSGIICFLMWLVFQQLSSFRTIFARIGLLYFLQVIAGVYLVLALTVISMAIPFSVINERVNKQFIDKKLPRPKFENFKHQLSSSLSTTYDSEEDSLKKIRSSVDALADFNSWYSDSLKSFRFTSSKMLTDTAIIETVLFRSGLGISEIDYQNGDKRVTLKYDRKAEKQSNHIKRRYVYFKDFIEEPVPSERYSEKIFKRTFKATDESGKPVDPIIIFYYHSPSQRNYKFADSTSIQSSLLLDRINVSLGDISDLEKARVLEKILDGFDDVISVNYIIPVACICVCLAFALLMFLHPLFKDGTGIIAVVLFALICLMVGIMFPRALSLSFYNNKALLIAISTLLGVSYMISYRKLRTNLKSLLLILVGLTTLCLSTILLAKLDPNISQVILKFSPEAYNKDFILIDISGLVTILVLIPWYFFARLYHNSLLPIS